MVEQRGRADRSFFHAITRVALVRLILFFVILITAYIGVQLALPQIAMLVPKGNAQLIMPAAVIGLCLVLLGVYALLVRWIERRRARELAPVRGLPLVIGGAIFGFAILCAVYFVLWAMGIAHWQGMTGVAIAASAVFMAAISAVGEELIMRGGVFRILEDSFGTIVALTLSAALFGLLHAFNHGATTVSTVAIALEAGVLLGAAYAATRNLWFPIGLHFGWNFTEGGIFGAAVSGFNTGKGVVSMPLSGSDLLTGGTFGPEASVVSIAVGLLAALLLIVMTIRGRRWVRLSFHMMLD